MPYITCKDGNTYSRYDQSDYVKQCILEEEKIYAECMANPNCKSVYKKNNRIMFGLLFILILLILASMIFSFGFKTK